MSQPFTNRITQTLLPADAARQPLGDCFQRNAVFALERDDVPGLEVVHGLVRDSWPPHDMIDHCWCEMPGVAVCEADDGTEFELDITVVADMTQQPGSQYIPAPMFYDATKAVARKRYPASTYAMQVLIRGTDGPWED